MLHTANMGRGVYKITTSGAARRSSLHWRLERRHVPQQRDNHLVDLRREGSQKSEPYRGVVLDVVPHQPFVAVRRLLQNDDVAAHALERLLGQRPGGTCAGEGRETARRRKGGQ